MNPFLRVIVCPSIDRPWSDTVRPVEIVIVANAPITATGYHVVDPSGLEPFPGREAEPRSIGEAVGLERRNAELGLRTYTAAPENGSRWRTTTPTNGSKRST